MVVIAEANKLAIKYLISLHTDASYGILVIFHHGHSSGDEDYNSTQLFLKKGCILQGSSVLVYYLKESYTLCSFLIGYLS